MATETTLIQYIEGAAAATPPAGRVYQYAKADGLLYSKDDAGTETPLGGGGGGGLTITRYGTTSAGASFATSELGYFKKITPAVTGLLVGVGALYKGPNTGSGHGMIALVQQDTAGAPTILLSPPSPYIDSASGKVMNFGNLNATVRAITIPVMYEVTSGTDFWIGVGLLDTDGSLAYNSGTGTDKTQAMNIGSDSSLSSFSNTTNDYCIYGIVIS